MKFGMLDFDKTVNWYWDNSWNGKALLNIGDAAEYLVIEELYRSMMIEEDKIVRLSINDLTAYRGETLVVALNISLDSYVGYNNILENLSPDIIPVFLGMCFTEMNMTEKQLACLKKYEPIGCRDERSYLFIKSKGIECYLNGCTASILMLPEKQIKSEKSKILFIDVPENVAKYVPEDIKKDIVFLNQEIYCRRGDVEKDFSPINWAKNIMREYTDNVRMIVTSRFHGAVLALSYDIPTVVTLEKYTFRFSWIKNYLKIHTEEDYDQIDWTAKKVNYKETRDLIKQVAIERIKETLVKFFSLPHLTEAQLTQEKQEKETSSQVLYYFDALEKIRSSWNANDNIKYAFWGINDNAVHLTNCIKKEYPNAELVAVYDMFKEISYDGIRSQHPDKLVEMLNEENFYVIVSAYLASRVATDICENIGFPYEKLILCERKFVSQKSFE